MIRPWMSPLCGERQRLQPQGRGMGLYQGGVCRRGATRAALGCKTGPRAARWLVWQPSPDMPPPYWQDLVEGPAGVDEHRFSFTPRAQTSEAGSGARRGATPGPCARVRAVCVQCSRSVRVRRPGRAQPWLSLQRSGRSRTSSGTRRMQRRCDGEQLRGARGPSFLDVRLSQAVSQGTRDRVASWLGVASRLSRPRSWLEVPRAARGEL